MATTVIECFLHSFHVYHSEGIKLVISMSPQLQHESYKRVRNVKQYTVS
jgi:hypothetical protein